MTKPKFSKNHQEQPLETSSSEDEWEEVAENNNNETKKNVEVSFCFFLVAWIFVHLNNIKRFCYLVSYCFDFDENCYYKLLFKKDIHSGSNKNRNG